MLTKERSSLLLPLK